MALFSRRGAVRREDRTYRRFEACFLLVISVSLLYIVHSPITQQHSTSAIATTSAGGILSRYLRAALHEHEADNVRPYNQDSIMKTAPKFPKFVPKLLVFDGNKFQAFGLEHQGTKYFDNMKYTYRYIDTIPMLAHSLQANFPERFQPGSPPFELLFTDADSPHSDCENDGTHCRVADFAPMILFGSVPKDESIYPTLRSFPHPVFMHCLYHYKVNGVEECDWPQTPNTNVPWDDLTDTVIWRGADWPFLPYITDRYTFEGPTKIMEQSQKPAWKDMTREGILEDLTGPEKYKTFPPRWRAALMSVQAETGNPENVPWIDTRFVGGMNPEIHAKLAKKGVNVTGDRMDAHEMSNYKYQVDYGGGGGTTWEGTLTKLMMPGVLFHHETETKDWYYDMMVPWKHYVPIKWDLSDLWTSFTGAQSNPQQMQDISAEATKLAKYMVSTEYMETVYQELFVEYLGKLVNAYESPPGATWSDLVAKYRSNGFHVYNIGKCEKKICHVECRKDLKEKVLFINSDQQKKKDDAAAEEEAAQSDATATGRALGTEEGQHSDQHQQQQQQQQWNQGNDYTQQQQQWGAGQQDQYGQQQQQQQQEQQPYYDASSGYASDAGYGQQQGNYNNNNNNEANSYGSEYDYSKAQQQQQQWSQGGEYAQQQWGAGQQQQQQQGYADNSNNNGYAAATAAATDSTATTTTPPEQQQQQEGSGYATTGGYAAGTAASSGYGDAASAQQQQGAGYSQQQQQQPAGAAAYSQQQPAAGDSAFWNGYADNSQQKQQQQQQQQQWSNNGY